MYNLQNADLKKEIEIIKRNEPGKVRATFLKSFYNYAKKTEGDEGLKKIEAEYKKAGYPMPNPTEMGDMEWLSSSPGVIFMVAMGKAFNWTEKNYFEFGKKYFAFPSTFKFFIKYFISPKKTLEMAAQSWKKHHNYGELKVVKYDPRRKMLVATLKDYKIHPVICDFHRGLFSQIIELATGKKTSSQETKCAFKGNSYHEYVFTWK